MNTKELLIIIITIALLFGGHKIFNDPAINRAHIAEGLVVASSVKIAISEYYASYGEFPHSNEELQLPAPEAFAGTALSALSVTEGGTIELRYNDASGIKDGQLLLIPDITDSALGIRWECLTHSYPDIKEFIPNCTYFAKATP